MSHGEKNIMDMKRLILKTQSKLHRNIYQLSNGKVGGRFGAPTLLITTIGRKSGKARTNPLFYLQDGNGWVVVASNAGSALEPSWWLNLQANSQAKVQIGAAQYEVLGRAATDEEYGRFWPQFLKMFPGYADYQAQTTRKITIVVLENQGEK